MLAQQLKNVVVGGSRQFSASSTRPMQDVVIASAVRTPIGSFQGALKSMTAPALGSTVISEAISRAGIQKEDVQEAYMGNVLSAAIGQAPTRQAVLGAGLPLSVPCTTLNKVCASGMKSAMMASQSIMLGHQDVMIAGGMESMSNVPYYLPKARSGFRLGNGEVVDGLVHDGLWDVYNNHHMGLCGEDCADKFGITREDMDAFAGESYRRAAKAWHEGLFSNEIAPVTLKGSRGKADVVVERDEEFENFDLEKARKLRPAFKKDGRVTAFNASTINDGASAMVLMSAAKAKELGVKPLARIRGFADAAQAPIEFTTAPSLAIPKALDNAGVSLSDVDYFEINQAFAVVSLANMKLLNLDPERVDVNGGAVSLGHPIGSSGARIMVTLLNVLQQRDASIGVAGICNGGGGASAIVVERL